MQPTRPNQRSNLRLLISKLTHTPTSTLTQHSHLLILLLFLLLWLAMRIGECLQWNKSGPQMQPATRLYRNQALQRLQGRANTRNERRQRRLADWRLTVGVLNAICVAIFAKWPIFVVACIYPTCCYCWCCSQLLCAVDSFVSFFCFFDFLLFCLLLQKLRNAPNLWWYSAALGDRRRSHKRAGQLIAG